MMKVDNSCNCTHHRKDHIQTKTRDYGLIIGSCNIDGCKCREYDKYDTSFTPVQWKYSVIIGTIVAIMIVGTIISLGISDFIINDVFSDRIIVDGTNAIITEHGTYYPVDKTYDVHALKNDLQHPVIAMMLIGLGVILWQIITRYDAERKLELEE